MNTNQLARILAESQGLLWNEPWVTDEERQFYTEIAEVALDALQTKHTTTVRDKT